MNPKQLKAELKVSVFRQATFCGIFAGLLKSPFVTP